MKMLRYLILIVLFSTSSIVAARGFADEGKHGPWFTGPLLAGGGKTIPPGYFNFSPYGFYSVYPAGFRNIELLPALSAGVLDFLDIQTAIPYDFSWTKQTHGNNVGDYSLGMGLQILRQKEHSIIPDFRFVIQEIFPTGRFDDLDLNKLGADQTGLGAYQTLFGFNLQRQISLPHEQYLRIRYNTVIGIASDVNIHGVSVYGGTPGTSGTVQPGNSYSFDFAVEYSITSNWVPVFEVLYVTSQATSFSGNPGYTPGGTIPSVGSDGGHQTSLAPALEYNVNDKLGFIAGVWFSIDGPAPAKFTTYAISVNYVF